MTQKELKQIYYINKEIIMWEKELERLNSKSLIKSPRLSHTPKGEGKLFSDTVIEKVDIEFTIKEKLMEIEKQRNIIMEYINSIDESLLRQIIYLRNASCMSWREIARELGEGYTEDAVRQRYHRFFKKR